MEDHNEINMELNLKLSVDIGRTRVNDREEHVERDLDVWHHITISHLDILNLSCVHLILKGLHPHKLDLYRFNQNL